MNQSPESPNDPFEKSNLPAVIIFLAGIALIAVSFGTFLVFVGNPGRKQRAPSEESIPQGSYQVLTCPVDMLQLCVNVTPAPGDRFFTPGPPATGVSWFDCQKPGKRVCLITIGSVDRGLVDRLRLDFEQEYGLTLLRGPSIYLSNTYSRSITRQSTSSGGPQLDAQALSDYLDILQKEAGTWNQALDGLTLIALTSSDIYLASSASLNFVFGQRFDYSIANGSAHSGIVSAYRMDDRNYGLRNNQKLLTERVEKMVGKYIGLYYFGLPLSSDPQSAMYDHIGGLADLDRMSNRLTVDQR